ncbi:MAG: hypothetical protein A2741_01565 [Candidatus Zambryskibacteria bacterium RIFCSPHIGHO2_01_FULL_43_27]|uniref:Uncharacterized protein n=1 Tax=Candidatus Zambryskibacteria bacterium RIFCSPLOWO2_01_FULL_43_17 TaxID=1802760 RepID=A0A1G2U4A2_9BACT|nr:MAG: hypothetical protein A2741_01565 [Candidatus Zambryskibacteria bacterium RIFCSPHIGHO2_01_FULL_43_27]OHA99474.1 MAG: hypothetical protein A3E93_02750 [Candidatus Zambryskibacteria bacterium RIFCSPHIGHO2_12_FULL_43_12b]OHB04315.1 MAG: hypothetical protein A2920_03340 [Candidatus Zambryskibacteria bacterium RIFCSPLOWO2_01_FULL_43_17]
MSRKGGDRVSPGQQAEPLDVQVNRILQLGIQSCEAQPGQRTVRVSSHSVTQADELAAQDDVRGAIFEAEKDGVEVDRELRRFDLLSSQRDAVSDGLFRTGEFRYMDPDNADPEDEVVMMAEVESLPEDELHVYSLGTLEEEDPIPEASVLFLRSVGEIPSGGQEQVS